MNQQTKSEARKGNWSSDDVEAILDAFEVELEGSGCADLRDFLPSPSSDVFVPVAIELIRIDLERSRSAGQQKQVEDYSQLAPKVFADPTALAAIAYEEYRLRRQAGERVDPAEYATRFSLDTSDWPTGGDSLCRSEASFQLNGKRAPRPGALRPGDLFDGFELTEILGRGAFGVVFRARQQQLADREVVLKITQPRSVEPQRLARLQHTNIVPIYSVHEDAGLQAICMPFLGRRTLADFVASATPLQLDQWPVSTVRQQAADTKTPPRPADRPVDTPASVGSPTSPPKVNSRSLQTGEIVEVVAQLAEGLAHAHERGIIHSDLKPANVLLSDDNTPLLVDFNLAAEQGAAERATMIVGGTLAYMAPEHIEAMTAGKLPAAISDIYSLGAIFFELLVGKRPFDAPTGDFESCAGKLIADRRRGAPQLSLFGAQISPALEAVVAYCLAADPARRYQSAKELADDLRRHQRLLPLRYAENTSVRERTQKWFRRNAAALKTACVGLLGVALLAALAMFAVRQARMRQFEADRAFDNFERDFVEASLNLNFPGSEPELYQLGRQSAEKALEIFPLGDKFSANRALWSKLSPAQQSQVTDQAAKLRYALAQTPAEKDIIASQHDASGSLGTYLHAIELLERRESSAALPIFERLRQRDPRDITLWLLLGNAYYRAHRLADAEACYTAVIALEPRAYAGYFYRGECRIDERRYAEAEQDFNAVLDMRPALPSALLNRAIARKSQGSLRRAESDVTSAIEGHFNDPRAFFVRAQIRDALGNSVGAQSDREHGFDLPPVDGKGWVAVGIARLRDDAQQARDAFEAGLKEYPNSPALLQNLVHVYGDRLAENELALAAANQLVDLCPQEPSAWAGRGVLRARLADFEGARNDARRAAAAQISPTTALQIAGIYALTGQAEQIDAERAIQFLQQSLAKAPQLSARAATDPDLAPLRSRGDFQALLATADRLSHESSAPLAAQHMESMLNGIED